MITVKSIEEAAQRIKQVVQRTPLMKDQILSERYGASVYLKREDLQTVRSYKIRGAFNKIASLTKEERVKGRSEEHTSELQSRPHLVCRLLLEKKKIHSHFDN